MSVIIIRCQCLWNLKTRSQMFKQLNLNVVKNGQSMLAQELSFTFRLQVVRSIANVMWRASHLVSTTTVSSTSPSSPFDTSRSSVVGARTTIDRNVGSCGLKLGLKEVGDRRMESREGPPLRSQSDQRFTSSPTRLRRCSRLRRQASSLPTLLEWNVSWLINSDLIPSGVCTSHHSWR